MAALDQRVRELFTNYSLIMGCDFRETSNGGEKYSVVEKMQLFFCFLSSNE